MSTFEEVKRTGAETGPKGVLADYNHYNAVERSKKAQAAQDFNNQLLAGGMASGWTAREIIREENERKGYKKEGLRHVDSAGFLQGIENERVLVHVHESSIKACQTLLAHLSELSHKFNVTFLSVDRSHLDAFKDADLLPILLHYESGELVESFFRVSDDIRGWSQGECEIEDVEQFLIKAAIIDKENDFDW